MTKGRSAAHLDATLGELATVILSLLVRVDWQLENHVHHPVWGVDNGNEDNEQTVDPLPRPTTPVQAHRIKNTMLQKMTTTAGTINAQMSRSPSVDSQQASSCPYPPGNADAQMATINSGTACRGCSAGGSGVGPAPGHEHNKAHVPPYANTQ